MTIYLYHIIKMTEKNDFDTRIDEFIKRIEETESLGEKIREWARKAWFQVLSEDEFLEWRERFKERKDNHIYGDDIDRLKNIETTKNSDSLEKALLYLQKENIGSSIEDILYNFYALYRNNNDIKISQDMKLRVKWQCKFRIENIIRMIENDPKQINDCLSHIKFILSPKYSKQICLDWPIAKDVKNEWKKWENIAYFLENHDEYEKPYKELIQELSTINGMNDIQETFHIMYSQRNTYSDEIKKEINGHIISIRDMGLQYSIDKKLFNRYLASLILIYNKIKNVTTIN